MFNSEIRKIKILDSWVKYCLYIFIGLLFGYGFSMLMLHIPLYARIGSLALIVIAAPFAVHKLSRMPSLHDLVRIIANKRSFKYDLPIMRRFNEHTENIELVANYRNDYDNYRRFLSNFASDWSWLNGCKIPNDIGLTKDYDKICYAIEHGNVTNHGKHYKSEDFFSDIDKIYKDYNSLENQRGTIKNALYRFCSEHDDVKAYANMMKNRLNLNYETHLLKQLAPSEYCAVSFKTEVKDGYEVIYMAGLKTIMEAMAAENKAVSKLKIEHI